MTTFISLLAVTKTGAIVRIVIFLLIAGVIAYLTAYYYYKPIYTRKIKALEDEKTDLARKISGLRSEIEQLNKEKEELREMLDKKKKE